MKIDRLEPTFVEYIPVDVEPGKLYISMTYATTVHLCASGCGNKVVLPLSPAEWQLQYDGRAVSLSPSVGNWDYPCQAHYWVRANEIRWARKWSRDEIEAGQRRDGRALDSMFKHDQVETAPNESTPEDTGIFERFLIFLHIRRK
jgi:hypothetical protein